MDFLNVSIVEYLASIGEVERALEVSSSIKSEKRSYIKQLELANEYKSAVDQSEFALAKQLIGLNDTKKFIEYPEIEAYLNLGSLVNSVCNTKVDVREVLQFVKSDLIPSIEKVRSAKRREEMSAILQKCMRTCIIYSERGTYPEQYDQFVAQTWTNIWDYLGSHFSAHRMERIATVVGST